MNYKILSGIFHLKKITIIITLIVSLNSQITRSSSPRLLFLEMKKITKSVTNDKKRNKISGEKYSAAKLTLAKTTNTSVVYVAVFSHFSLFVILVLMDR